METRLKQRMIGAIVLTALAIIILPMLLDGSAEDRARVIARIPEPPAVELKKLTVSDIDRKMQQMETDSAAKLPQSVEPPPADNATDTGPAATTASPATAKAEPTTTADAARAAPTAEGADELALDKDNLPISWSLQLGAFKNHENALKLRDDLRQAEFRAYIIAAQTEEGSVYKVFVGPMLEKSRLARIGEQIQSKFDLKGQIVRYKIADDAGQLGG